MKSKSLNKHREAAATMRMLLPGSPRVSTACGSGRVAVADLSLCQYRLR